LTSTYQSINFAGDIGSFNKATALTLLAKGYNVGTANINIVAINSGSVNVIYQLVGLTAAQIQLALAYFRVNCATLLSQSGVDCNSIASSPVQANPTQCYFGDLNVPSGVSAVGPGCAVGSIVNGVLVAVLVDHTKSCVFLSTAQLTCVNPTCNAGKWTTNYPCRTRDPSNSSLTGGTIAGIVIGCVLGVVGLLIVIGVAIAITAPPKHLPADGSA